MNRFAFHFLSAWSRLLLVYGLFASSVLRAQNPEVAPADLNFSRAAFTHNHLVVRVELRVERNKYVHYQYDRYPDLVRIKMDDGVTYAKPKAKAWLKSEDWGETGTKAEAGKVLELDADAKMAELPLQESKSLDPTQGGTVWKLVSRTKKEINEYFTYEKSRERPRAGGVYSRYTFVKFKGDSDGKLLLSHYSGQLRADARLIPMEAQFDLLIQLPPGSVKFERAPDPRKKGDTR